MASRIILLRLEKILNTAAKSRFQQRNTRSIKTIFAFPSRIRPQGFGSARSSRIKVDFRSNLKYLRQRVRPIKIKCPEKLINFQFLNKGCNGVICSIPDDNKLVAKQAYKFNPYHSDSSQMSHENDILDKLQGHPNVIQKVSDKEMVSDICKDPSFKSSCPDVEHCGLTPTLILERMTMSLEELLKIEDLSLIDRIDILSQILEAQVYMGKKLICHRDMKLSNVLIKVAPSHEYAKYPRRFIVKVADFDLALDMSVKSSEFSGGGACVSTAPEILGYMERNRNNKCPTQLLIVLDNKKLYYKSDIWAIGGMAYEIFGYENPFVKLDAAKYSLYDLPSMEGLPAIICGLIKCLLQPKPEFRYHASVAADILQMFRFKMTLTEKVFQLVEGFPLHTMVAFCYMNQLHFTGTRFLADPKRMQFVFNYINE